MAVAPEVGWSTAVYTSAAGDSEECARICTAFGPSFCQAFDADTCTHYYGVTRIIPLKDAANGIVLHLRPADKIQWTSVHVLFVGGVIRSINPRFFVISMDEATSPALALPATDPLAVGAASAHWRISDRIFRCEGDLDDLSLGFQGYGCASWPIGTEGGEWRLEASHIYRHVLGFSAVMPSGNELFWAGGLSDEAELYRKDVGWEALPSLPESLSECGCAAYNDTAVFIVAGWSNRFRTETFLYNVVTGETEFKAAYAHEVVVAAVARVWKGGKHVMFVYGGRLQFSSAPATVRFLDVEANTWSTASSNPSYSTVFGSWMLPIYDGGTVLVLGGNVNGNTVTDLIFEYDVSNDAWTQLSAVLPSASAGYAFQPVLIGGPI